MKANELRIGNWYDHNKIPTQVTPNTIEEVWEAERIWCKAIPLTEEWLLKFGFIKSSDNNYYKGGKFTIYNRFGNFGLIGGSLSWKEFKHVHQLQNLYFALTGEELTYGGNK